jgi:hypothetical protein
MSCRRSESVAAIRIEGAPIASFADGSAVGCVTRPMVAVSARGAKADRHLPRGVARQSMAIAAARGRLAGPRSAGGRSRRPSRRGSLPPGIRARARSPRGGTSPRAASSPPGRATTPTGKPIRRWFAPYRTREPGAGRPDPPPAPRMMTTPHGDPGATKSTETSSPARADRASAPRREARGSGGRTGGPGPVAIAANWAEGDRRGDGRTAGCQIGRMLIDLGWGRLRRGHPVSGSPCLIPATPRRAKTRSVMGKVAQSGPGGHRPGNRAGPRPRLRTPPPPRPHILGHPADRPGRRSRAGPGSTSPGGEPPSGGGCGVRRAGLHRQCPSAGAP